MSNQHLHDLPAFKPLQPSDLHYANDLDYPTAERPHKAFCSLRSQFALLGHALYRSDPQDGAVTYWTACAGTVKPLPSLEAAQCLLTSIHRERRHG
jgi:hypothetical protein